MNDRQRMFVAEYAKDRNATQAAIRAGYSARSARVTSTRLLANAAIRAAVDEKLAEAASAAGMSAAEVLRTVAGIARNGDSKDADRLKALELIGKHHKLWTERMQLGGDEESGPVRVTVQEQFVEPQR